MYSMDAYKALQQKDAKLLDLQKRRKRLADLLAEEREQLHVSLVFLFCMCVASFSFLLHAKFFNAPF